MNEYESRAASEQMFRMAAGVPRTWAAIEWLIAAPDEGDTPMLEEARRAALALPRDMNELSRGLKEAWEQHDRERAEDLRELAYQLLIARDLLDDLDERGHRLFDETPVREALIAFDDGLDDADWWIHQLDDGDDYLEALRVEMGERPGKSGRRWWQPATLLDGDVVEDPMLAFRQLVADARGVPIEQVARAEWGEPEAPRGPGVRLIRFSGGVKANVAAGGFDASPLELAFEGPAPVRRWRADELDVRRCAELPEQGVVVGWAPLSGGAAALVVDAVAEAMPEVRLVLDEAAEPGSEFESHSRRRAWTLGPRWLARESVVLEFAAAGLRELATHGATPDGGGEESPFRVTSLEERLLDQVVQRGQVDVFRALTRLSAYGGKASRRQIRHIESLEAAGWKRAAGIYAPAVIQLHDGERAAEVAVLERIDPWPGQARELPHPYGELAAEALRRLKDVVGEGPEPALMTPGDPCRMTRVFDHRSAEAALVLALLLWRTPHELGERVVVVTGLAGDPLNLGGRQVTIEAPATASLEWKILAGTAATRGPNDLMVVPTASVPEVLSRLERLEAQDGSWAELRSDVRANLPHASTIPELFGMVTGRRLPALASDDIGHRARDLQTILLSGPRDDAKLVRIAAGAKELLEPIVHDADQPGNSATLLAVKVLARHERGEVRRAEALLRRALKHADALGEELRTHLQALDCRLQDTRNAFTEALACFRDIVTEDRAGAEHPHVRAIGMRILAHAMREADILGEAAVAGRLADELDGAIRAYSADADFADDPVEIALSTACVAAHRQGAEAARDALLALLGRCLDAPDLGAAVRPTIKPMHLLAAACVRGNKHALFAQWFEIWLENPGERELSEFPGEAAPLIQKLVEIYAHLGRFEDATDWKDRLEVMAAEDATNDLLEAECALARLALYRGRARADSPPDPPESLLPDLKIVMDFHAESALIRARAAALAHAITDRAVSLSRPALSRHLDEILLAHID